MALSTAARLTFMILAFSFYYSRVADDDQCDARLINGNGIIVIRDNDSQSIILLVA